MKKLLAAIIMSLFCLTAAHAQTTSTYLDVHMSWNYQADATNLVDAFVIYCARDGGTNFIPVVTVPATTNAAKARIRITPGVTKQLTFMVKARNVNGLSDFSNPASVPESLPANAPTDLIIFQSTSITITNQ